MMVTNLVSRKYRRILCKLLPAGPLVGLVYLVVLYYSPDGNSNTNYGDINLEADSVPERGGDNVEPGFAQHLVAHPENIGVPCDVNLWDPGLKGQFRLQ